MKHLRTIFIKDMLVALKVSVWSRGRLVTLQILTNFYCLPAGGGGDFGPTWIERVSSVINAASVKLPAAGS